MFNRKFVTETKMVKTSRKQQEPTLTTVSPEPTPSWIDKIQRKDVFQAAAGVVGIYATVKLINTLSTIAINYAPKN